MVAIFLAPQKSCRVAKQTSQVDLSFGAGQCLPLLETDSGRCRSWVQLKASKCFPVFVMKRHWLARSAREKSATSSREQMQQHAYAEAKLTRSRRRRGRARRPRAREGMPAYPRPALSLAASSIRFCATTSTDSFGSDAAVRGPNSFGLAMLATRRPAFFAPMISPVCAAAETIMHSPGGRSNIQQRRDRLVVLAVVASNLGAENGIEAKLVAPSEIGHQRDVGIGNWRQQEIIGQASKPPALRPVTHPADARQGLSCSPRLQSNP